MFWFLNRVNCGWSSGAREATNYWRIGEGVVIIGSPGGSKGSVTVGIVSQVYPNEMIQLNASVNSGNSGGPVFDMQGRVFGIATQKVREFVDGQSVDGLAIAIPIGWLSGH